MLPEHVADRQSRRRLAPASAGAALGRREFAVIAAAVTALHFALLLALAADDDAPPQGAAAAQRKPAAMQVRALMPALPVAALQATPIAPPRAAPAPRSRPHVAVVANPSAQPLAETPRDEPRAKAPPAAEGEVPVYRTLPPPAFAYAYDLQRGTERGSLELHWRSDASGYEARLEGELGGKPLLTLQSAGGFDAAGLAPQRHTDRRRGRSLQAANFQRDAGRITFSGPATEHALPAGVQDRLSWLLQLAAIAAAEPALAGPGGRISLVVVGVRGDAGVWTFTHAGDEALALAGGASAQTIRMLRQPVHPYDTRAEVWLDPARHFLPLRARLSNPPSGRDALQLDWREALAQP